MRRLREGFAILVCLALVVSGGGRQATEEDGVLVLDDKTFAEAVKNNPVILVEFYAPWCGHCQELAPHYAAAAKQLKASGIPLAKVDATAEAKLTEEYGIRGYPTIRLFLDGRDQEYNGGRNQESIVAWVLKKAGPAVVLLETASEADRFKSEHRIAAIGFFDGGARAHREAFERAAKQVEDVVFAVSVVPSVVERFEGAVVPGVRMFFGHDEKVATFSGDLQNSAELEAFVKAHRHPMVTNFNADRAPELFSDGRPILLLFRNQDEAGLAAEKEVREAAPGLHRRILVSVAGSKEPMDQRLMDYVSVDPEELPTVRLVHDPLVSMTKYKLHGKVTSSAILAFVSNFEAGRLKPHLRSQAPPTSQTGPVHVLVGSTFEATVKDPNKDVLVEFYAPWCGHCKKLEPVYRDVAKRLENVGSLLIAKIDAAANDAPLEYDGDRDVDSFVAWLEEKASIPFNRDELKTEL